MDYSNSFKWSAILKLIPARQLVLTITYGIIRIAISLVWPYILYRYIKNNDLKSVGELSPAILLILVLFILYAVVSYLQSAINLKILQAFSTRLTTRVWEKMANLDWLTFHGRNRVYYFDLLMIDTWRLRTGLGALLETLIVNGVIVVVLTCFIALISIPLFLLCLGALLITVAGQFLSMVKSRPYMRHFHNAWRHQHHWIAKSVDQFDLLKLKRGYEESVASHHKNTGDFLASNARMIENQTYWRNINLFISNIVRVGILVTGLYWVQQNYVQISELLFVFLIVTVIQGNLTQAPGALNSFMEAQEAIKSILHFFGLPEESSPVLPEISAIREISIRNLAFSFPGSDALLQTDFDLKRGKIYLWKGKNGTGKSTAAHLLLGLLTPREGSLFINGIPMEWDTLKTVRNRFAFLNQYSPVFMGTIRENTVFGHPEKEKAWNDVTGSWLSGLLPSGHEIGERKVGERGEGLSGGEAKRVALIRELLRAADVLILDEPLNHLDLHAISEIKREVVRLKENTIIIIISHQHGFEDIADETKHF